MKHKVKYTYSDSTKAKASSYFMREGIEVYRHPKGYFVTLEFQGKLGKFREAFWPNELIRIPD